MEGSPGSSRVQAAGLPGRSDHARGALLWEYRPPRAHPILYAGLILTSAVFVTGSLENLVRDRRADLELLYALPVVVIAFLMAALWPSNVRIFSNGIAPSRVLALRWFRPFIPWTAVTSAFPASYDVTGAFVSPFASSDGKVTQTGLGLELAGGGRETIRFTPTRFSLTARRSRGYKEAMDVVRDLFAGLGRPLVAQGEGIAAGEREALLRQAREPFLPFFAIVFLFAAAAPILWLLTLIPGMREAWPVAMAIAVLVPLGTSLQSWRKSRQRNRILDRLSKAAEYERTLAGEPAPATLHEKAPATAPADPAGVHAGSREVMA